MGIKFTWQKDEKSKEYLKNWIIEKKNSTRVEDLRPSDWFKQQWSAWEKSVAAWNKALTDHKKSVAEKAVKKRRKEQAKIAAEKAAEAKKKAEEDKAKKAAEAK